MAKSFIYPISDMSVQAGATSGTTLSEAMRSSVIYVRGIRNASRLVPTMPSNLRSFIRVGREVITFEGGPYE